MRIIKYTVELDVNKKNILVKEKSQNCPEISNLNEPSKIRDMLNIVFHANCKAEEYVWLIAMDSKCNPIGLFELSHGTVNSSLVSPREVFVRLCLCGAASCILAHNHPSGNPTPSTEDINVTATIKEASIIMNIKLLDHIIIGNDDFQYYSFAENRVVVGQ